jgi:hypothetical protein
LHNKDTDIEDQVLFFKSLVISSFWPENELEKRKISHAVIRNGRRVRPVLVEICDVGM